MLMLMIDCWDDVDDDHHDVQEEREKEEQLDRELLEMARRKARDGDFKIDNDHVLDKPARLIIGFASDLYLSNATNLQIAMLSTISDQFNAVTGECKRKHCVSS